MLLFEHLEKASKSGEKIAPLLSSQIAYSQSTVIELIFFSNYQLIYIFQMHQVPFIITKIFMEALNEALCTNSLWGLRNAFMKQQITKQVQN